MNSKQLLLQLLLPLAMFGQTTGNISGIVRSKISMNALPAANVLVLNTESGAATSLSGYYNIRMLEPGTYSLVASYIGFETIVRTDVVVKAGRTITIDFDLEENSITIEGVTINAGYFNKNRVEPVRIITFNSEEIRRAPGSAGDISRIISALPSTSHASDQANDLMVRGGSPIENGFYIDNIQVTNINHFGNQGSSGGPIGMLNVEFIENVEFYAGGFSASYGDRMSSIIDIQMRRGNRNEVDVQVDLGMGGAGIVAEGPIKGGKGAWLGSYRKSFIELISDAIGMGGVVPQYHDVHAKIDYDISSKDHLSVLLLGGESAIEFTKVDINELGQAFYGGNKVGQLTVGTNWRHIWGKNGYMNTSLAYTGIRFEDRWNDKSDDSLVFENMSLESAVRIRSINYYRHNKNFTLITGIDGAIHDTNIKYFYASGIDAEDNPYQAISVAYDKSKIAGGLFANFIWTGIPKLTTNLSGRIDYNGFNQNTYIMPRFLAGYQLTQRLKLRGAWGVYRQGLPGFLQAQEEGNENLDDPRSVHYIFGLDYLLQEATQLSIDVYRKDYNHLPLEPESETHFVIDDANSLRRFRHYKNLVATGQALSQGVEVLVQKKLAETIYGLVGGSYSRSTFKPIDGVWRDRAQDNRVRFNIVGGYKPNNKLEISFRWNFSGGAPYTPIDIAASTEAGIAIYDETQRLRARYPAYHALNLRIDQRKQFKWGNFVSYFSVWNAYNRENIAYYYWNEDKNQLDYQVNWSVLPVGGFELEF